MDTRVVRILLLCIGLLCLAAVGGAAGETVETAADSGDGSGVDSIEEQDDVSTDSLVAAFDWDPEEPAAGVEVTFDASASTGTIQSYAWDFTGNDEIDNVTENPVTTYTYDSAGEYNVTLQVTNETGGFARTTQGLSVVDDSPGGAEFAVTIVDGSEPVEGDLLYLTTLVENIGDADGTQTITLDVPGLGSNQTDLTLASGESTPVTLTIETGAGDAGEYTATAASDDDTDSVNVSVFAPAEFTVDILAVGSPVEGENLDVTAQVENVGDFADTQNLTLEVPGLGTDETALTLAGGDSTEETLTLGTTEGDAGNYTATVSTANDTAVAGAVVLDPAEFVVSITGTETSQGVLDVGYQVENLGNVETTKTVAFSVNGTIESERNHTLAGGESISDSFTYDIEVGDAPGVLVGIASKDDGDEQAVSVDPAQLDVAILETNTPVVEGEALEVLVEATNVGDEPAAETVGLLDFDGTLVDEQAVNVTGGNTTQATLAWATQEGDAGAGNVTVESKSGEPQSVPVEVLSPAAFTVEILDVTEPVAGEDVAVTASVENTGDVEATQTVELDVPGLGANSTTVTLAGGDSTEVTLAVGTGAGDAGEYTATVASENDTDSQNVTVLAPAAFEVAIVGTGEPVEGEDLAVTASVENTGNVEDTGTVSLDVGPLGTNTTTVTLAGGESVEETLTVGTDAGDAGEYNATVASEDDEDSATVAVLAQAAFAVEIVDVTSAVEGEAIGVTAAVENTGDVEDTQTVGLDVPGLGANSTTVTLAGGDATEVPFTVATEAGDAGTYTATVATDDDTDSQNVTVVEAGAFTVEIVGAVAPVEGAPLTVTASVENTGDTAGTQTLALDVAGLGANSTTVDLDGGESTEETLAVDTGAGDAGEYTATVSTANDTDSTAVSVLAPAEFGIEIVDATTPVAGESLNVTAAVENLGDVADTQTVGLTVEGLGADSTTVDLDGGEAVETTLTVATGAGDAGAYTATVATDDDTDSQNVTVVEQAAFAVEIVDTTEPVAGEPLNVTAVVENTGGETATQTVALTVDGLGTDNATVELDGGNSTAVTLAVATGAGDAGAYTATVASDDDTDSQNVTVTGAAAFEVASVETNVPVVAGEDLTVTVTVENVGNAVGTGTLGVDAGALGANETAVTLDPGATTEETLVLPTESDQVGAYNLTVTVGADTVEQPVEVTLPALPGFDAPPQDPDDDGLYEDIDGSDAFDIFDVQALFNSLGSSELDAYAWAFNFNDDENPDSVNIFDVQALFNEL